MSNQEVFDSIYTNSVWGYKSGPGSDPFTARTWIDVVNFFIKTKEICSILEVGCGDWQVGSKYNLDGIFYKGIDASSVIIEEVKSTYETDNIQFLRADAETVEFPKADLILCKDVLQHLPNSSVAIIMKKILENSRYALICDDWTETNTGDIEAGGHRRLNLMEGQFDYPLVQVCRYGSEDKAIYYLGTE